MVRVGRLRFFETLVGKSHVSVYTVIEKIKKEKIQMERRAKDITRGRVHIPTRREYAKQEEIINANINDKENRLNLSFLRGIAHNIKL